MRLISDTPTTVRMTVVGLIALCVMMGGAFGGVAATEDMLIEIPDTELAEGETTEIAIVMNEAPTGLSGFTLSVPGITVVDVVGIEEADIELLDEGTEIGEDGASVLAVDFDEEIDAGDEDIVLFELEIAAVEEGAEELTVDVEQMDDNDGEPIHPAINDGLITVQTDRADDPDDRDDADDADDTDDQPVGADDHDDVDDVDDHDDADDTDDADDDGLPGFGLFPAVAALLGVGAYVMRRRTT